MAGTIFGLPLSQRVDSNGKPCVGWLLYLYTQNTSTPVTSYQDTGLTVANPWPLAADANGMMPQFWLADGSYRARGTTADGATVFFDIQVVQSLGPSAGAAPSGSVDPNAIFQTGDLIWLDFQGTRTGWVRDNGRTIGSATSGATERANADCQSLFEYLWNNFSDTLCPVLTGRGASALNDWNANKQITMPDKRGYIAGGLDDMGNSAASRWTSVPVVTGNVTTAGSIIGETLHTLVTAEMPSHTHTATVTDPGHGHAVLGATGTGAITTVHLQDAQTRNFAGDGTAAGSGYVTNAPASGNPFVQSSTTGITVSNASQGSGTAHNVVQKTVLGTFFRKL